MVLSRVIDMAIQFLMSFFTPFFPIDRTWPIPNLKQPHKMWAIGSSVVIPTVGMFSKFIANWLNTTTIHNKKILTEVVNHRPSNKPLITVSNHHSCMDDPLLWSALNLSHFLNPRKYVRWSLAAHDICFTNEFHALFFSLGQSVPVVRGNGVYQKAMDFVLERLNKGEWVHIFPEGRVNLLKENLRFKWGIGRLITESKICPLVLPMFHLGMDDISPNKPPYYPRWNKKVTILIGKPIDLEETVEQLKCGHFSASEKRKKITDIVQEELLKLKDEAQHLHANNASKN